MAEITVEYIKKIRALKKRCEEHKRCVAEAEVINSSITITL